MKYEELIVMAENLIRSYDPSRVTVDSHFEEFIQEHLKKLFDTEVMFLKQVFTGVLRYEEFLKILTKALFKANSGTTNRNDGVMYLIFGYLIIFRLDELPFSEFKKMVKSQDAVKMNVFFSFLFDIKKIDALVRPHWIELYDPDYVAVSIIGLLEIHKPLMMELLQSVSARATGKRSEVQADESFIEEQSMEKDGKIIKKRSPTTLVPFKLTEMKPREIPEPIVISKVIKPRLIPKSLNQISLNTLDEQKSKKKEETKLRITQEYKESKQKPFDFQTDKRPNNFEKIKQQVEEDELALLQFGKKFAKPMPQYKDDAEVKLNAAAILREEILLQRKQEIEKNRVQALEVNMRDSGEFDEWQTKMKDKDMIEQLEHQQKKKAEMELTREAAIRAQEEKIQQNHRYADQIKADMQIQLKEREELQKEQVDHNRKLIEMVTEGEKNVAVERERLAERNRRAADEAKVEMARLIERKKLEDEQIRQKKEELIKQIRELEKQPRKRTKGYDPTETMGFGLLEELSLADLRERLDLVKQERKAEEESRRNDNAQKKDEYLNSLQKKVNDIKQHRTEQRDQREMENDQKRMKKTKEDALRQEIREQQLIEVQKKIKDKKHKKQMEDERIGREVKETKLKQQYMNANKAMVEEKAWKSQQDGLEREIKERQNDKLLNQERIESIRNKESKILANAAKSVVETKIAFNQGYDRTLSQAHVDNDAMIQEDRKSKTQNYQGEREWQMEHTKNMVLRDQYKSKLAQMSLDNSKKSLNNRSLSARQNQIKLPQPQYPTIKEEIDV